MPTTSSRKPATAVEVIFETIVDAVFGVVVATFVVVVAVVAVVVAVIDVAFETLGAEYGGNNSLKSRGISGSHFNIPEKVSLYEVTERIKNGF